MAEVTYRGSDLAMPGGMPGSSGESPAYSPDLSYHDVHDEPTCYADTGLACLDGGEWVNDFTAARPATGASAAVSAFGGFDDGMQLPLRSAPKAAAEPVAASPAPLSVRPRGGRAPSDSETDDITAEDSADTAAAATLHGGSPAMPCAKRPRVAATAAAAAAESLDEPAAKRLRSTSSSPVAPVAEAASFDGDDAAAEDGEEEEEEDLTTVGAVINEYPLVIHRGDAVHLAATPEKPHALSDMLAFLAKNDFVETSSEEWDPLVRLLCADEGREADCAAPAPCVVSARLGTNAYMRFRNKQLEWQQPYNAWYNPGADAKTKAAGLVLRSTVKLHSHQEEALSKVVRGGYAGSGCVVLPCGSGKTLTGIALACKLNKATLIVCNSLTSVAQWQASVAQFCVTRKGFKVGVFSLKHELPKDCTVVLTTYSILAADRGRANRSSMGRLGIELTRWGLVLLDEVHCVPTATFQKALGKVHTKCIVGLTATPLREDGKMNDLPFLIGPVTFYEEASWGRLTRNGFLARVQCVEVMCSLDPVCSAALKATKKVKGAGAQRRELLTMANPTKLRACQALMAFHEGQGDKVMIFCDSIYVLEYLGRVLDRPVVQGSTKETDKMMTMNEFRMNSAGGTVLFSRVGDTSIDLPEANVIIEVGAHFGSRCQETQRFGRVSRPKFRHPEASADAPEAFFYSLLTDSTDEVKFGERRREFLVDKGYDFAAVSGDELIQHHISTPGAPPLILGKKEEKVRGVIGGGGSLSSAHTHTHTHWQTFLYNDVKHTLSTHRRKCSTTP